MVHRTGFFLLVSALVLLVLFMPTSLLGREGAYDRFLDCVVVIESSEGFGTGFFVTGNGLLVTNLHVVGGDRTVSVTLRNGTVTRGTIQAVNEDLDLALISVPYRTPDWLHFAESGEGGVGADVIAIGTAQGLSWSVSKGIISGVRETDRIKFIQTDAAINPGNSGGPLILLASGRVIGVNTITFKKDIAEGISFAVSADNVRATFSDYLKAGVEKGPPPPPPVAKGDPPPSCDVLQAQRILQQAGYSVHPDGELGPQTSKAVREYQAANGLDQTGLLDEATCQHLKYFASATSPGTAAQETAEDKSGKEEAAYHARIAKLDTEIKELEKRLKSDIPEAEEDLDVMLEKVQEKEAEERLLETLKRTMAEEEARWRQRRAARAEEDIAKYETIVSSKYGEKMAESAWQALVAKYPEEAKGLESGDTGALRFKIKGGPGGFINSIGVKFVLIPAGNFLMGSPQSEGDADEYPRHKVEITEPFYLGIYEVTQAQWQVVMGNNPSHFKGDDRPVDLVSWNDVQEFIRRLNQKEGTDKYRLPTEAEWEYACRGGSETVYCFGDENSRLGEYAWYTRNSGGQTRPVGQKKPNAWGLYDMHGNVWEWCADWYEEGYYRRSPSSDPRGPSSGSGRVLRGGSWYLNARNCRSASRNRHNPVFRSLFDGFRLARITP